MIELYFTNKSYIIGRYNDVSADMRASVLTKNSKLGLLGYANRLNFGDEKIVSLTELFIY